MVWPLVCERVRGITQTFWMGDPVSQYGDVLIDADVVALPAMRAALDFLRARTNSDLLRLRRVRSDSNVAPLMGANDAQVADRQLAPFMDLTTAKDFAAFEQRYSAKTRKNRRRLARRLEEKGTVEFLRLRGGDEARALAVEAINLKAAWLKDRGLVSSAIANERMSCLFADLAEGHQKPVECIVSALKSNGEAAALEVSFTCKGRLAMHLIAFNLEYEKIGRRCPAARTEPKKRLRRRAHHLRHAGAGRPLQIRLVRSVGRRFGLGEAAEPQRLSLRAAVFRVSTWPG